MDDEIKMEDELYHHGILGMRWGIRRTPAQLGHTTGRAKAKARAKSIEQKAREKEKEIKQKQKNQKIIDKAKAKADARLAKVRGENPKKTSEKTSTSPKKKTISEMSNDELREQIDRITLENSYKSLNPKKVSAGEKFMRQLGSAALDKATKVAIDYADKKLREATGLSKKEVNDGLSELAKKAEKAGYEKKIAEAESAMRKNKNEKDEDAKRAKRKKEEQSKKEKTEYREDNKTWTGTVEGEGTSSRTYTNPFSNSQRSSWADDVVDAEWWEVNDSDVSSGKTYIAGLLEDKSRK